jgi:hypothetical protein
MASCPRASYRSGVSIVRIVTRPVRAETWRELAYVVLGLPLSVLVFGLELAVVVSGSVLLITLIGVPILLAGAYMNRFFADVERRRAGFLLRARIEAGYRDASGVGFWRRARIVGGDPQTWKDFLCMLVLIFLGFGFGVASLTLWASALGWATLPAWWWIPPPGTVVDLGSWSVDRWSHALLVGAVGLAATVPVAWLVAGFARGQALLTRALLAPSERQLLRTRVEELSRTRAGAVDAQAEALERIERDLHDGAQRTARLGRARARARTREARRRPGRSCGTRRVRPRGRKNRDR